MAGTRCYTNGVGTIEVPQSDLCCYNHVTTDDLILKELKKIRILLEKSYGTRNKSR